MKTDVPQNESIIGVPAYQNLDEIKLTKILPPPFEKQKADRHLTAIELKAVALAN